MNAPLPHITPLIERGDNWRYSAICRLAPDQFEAFIKTSRGTYPLGMFKTLEEAEQAIEDAEAATWNG